MKKITCKIFSQNFKFLLFFTLALQIPIQYSYSQPPDWSFNAFDYQYSMSVTAVVYLDMEEQNNPNLFVGVFRGDTCFGFAKTQKLEQTGRYLAFLLVYSNNPYGDSISFNVFADSVIIMPQKVMFQADASIGGPTNPFILSKPALINEAFILNFSISGQSAPTHFDMINKIITVPFPQGTPVNQLVPEFTVSTGATAYVNSVEQQTGINIHNFSEPVFYEVISNDLSKINEYKIIIDYESQSVSYGADFLSFSVSNQISPAIIDSTINMISATISAESSLNLKPVFTLSPQAIALFNQDTIKSGITELDFSSPVTVQVKSQVLQLAKNWQIILTKEDTATITDPVFLSFVIDQQIGETTINTENKTIQLTVPASTNLNALIPDFIVSTNAEVSMNSTPVISKKTVVDFSATQYFKLTQGDKFSIWEIIVTKEDEVTIPPLFQSFRIGGQMGDTEFNNEDNTLLINMPKGSDLSKLTPTFSLYPGAKAYVDGILQQSGVNTQNFNVPVLYSLVTEDDLTQIWNVVVTAPALSNTADFISFSLKDTYSETLIDKTNKIVDVTVATGTNLQELIAIFELTENSRASVHKTIQQSGITMNDFSFPLVYNLIAENNDTVQWQVAISVSGELSGNSILSFKVPGQVGNAQIDPDLKLIDIIVGKDTDKSQLNPEFLLSQGAIAFINDLEQKSGISVVDFSSPVTYNIQSLSGSVQDWQVFIEKISENTENDFISYSVPQESEPAIINTNNNSITVILNINSALTNLIPEFQLSDGAKASINSTQQVSRVTSISFLTPQKYQVKAANGAIKTWTVEAVFKKQNKQADILYFEVENQVQSSIINPNAKRIDVIVPFGTNKTSLTPIFRLSENAKAFIGDNEQISSTSIVDFAEPVTYTIVSEDTIKSKNWLVVITSLEPESGNDILSFDFPFEATSSFINSYTNRIDVNVQQTTNLKSLIAEFELSEGAIAFVNNEQQFSGGSRNNYTNPVQFLVKAQNEEEQIWDVFVAKPSPSLGADFLSFRVKEQTKPATINRNGRRIDVTLEPGTLLESLTPEFQLSPEAKAYIDNSLQQSGANTINFENEVIYEIRNKDGVSDYWTVNMSLEALSDSADLTSYNLPQTIQPAILNPYLKRIDLTFNKNTLIDNLKPEFTHSSDALVYNNGNVQQSGVSQINFNQPVQYTILAEDGQTSKKWNVYPNNPPLNSGTEFLNYNLPGQIGQSIINPYKSTIDIIVPSTFDMTRSIADFTTSNNANVSISSIEQHSGVTANSYQDTLVYVIKSEDSLYTQKWSVIVSTKQELTEPMFHSYNVSNQAENPLIHTDKKRIIVTLPSNIDVRLLKATFELTPNTTAYINGTEQNSGVSENNYSNLLKYKLQTTENSMNEWYILPRIQELSHENDIIEFSVRGQISGSIVNSATKRINVKVHSSVDLSFLSPEFVLSKDAKALYMGEEIQSGKSVIDAQQPIIWQIMAEDGESIRNWSIIIEKEDASSEAEFLTFNLPGQTEAPYINSPAARIEITLQKDMNIEELIANFNLSKGASAFIGDVPQISGLVPNNFSYGQLYSVIAEDGTTEKLWTIIVRQNELSNKTNFISFTLSEQTSYAIINQSTHRIDIETKPGSDLTALFPVFILSPGAKTYINGTEQTSGVSKVNFQNQVVYSVLAENKIDIDNWIVTVNKESLNIPDLETNSQNIFRQNIASQKIVIQTNLQTLRKIQIIDINGKHMKTIAELNSHVNSIDLSSLAPGIYFLVIQNNTNQSMIYKFIHY